LSLAFAAWRATRTSHRATSLQSIWGRALSLKLEGVTAVALIAAPAFQVYGSRRLQDWPEVTGNDGRGSGTASRHCCRGPGGERPRSEGVQGCRGKYRTKLNRLLAEPTVTDASLAARARERRPAEAVQYHATADLVAVDRSVKFERHRHRVTDRDLPGHCIAISSTVEDFGRTPVIWTTLQLRLR
jgi:hypothetical protein